MYWQVNNQVYVPGLMAPGHISKEPAGKEELCSKLEVYDSDRNHFTEEEYVWEEKCPGRMICSWMESVRMSDGCSNDT